MHDVLDLNILNHEKKNMCRELAVNYTYRGPKGKTKQVSSSRGGEGGGGRRVEGRDSYFRPKFTDLGELACKEKRLSSLLELTKHMGPLLTLWNSFHLSKAVNRKVESAWSRKKREESFRSMRALQAQIHFGNCLCQRS